MRAVYKIKTQEQGEEPRVIFTSTRKSEIEQQFRRTLKSYKSISSYFVQMINMGYAKITFYGSFSISETEIWICKE